MDVVSKRELSRNLSATLDRVTAGRALVVAERGVPRWTITATVPPSAIDRLEQAGRVTRAADVPVPWGSSDGREYSPAEIDALIAETRGDR
jgi:antitoxin (DNA-binding transcriptional repressor) of toxin-antitoxin stability system